MKTQLFFHFEETVNPTAQLLLSNVNFTDYSALVTQIKNIEGLKIPYDEYINNKSLYIIRNHNVEWASIQELVIKVIKDFFDDSKLIFDKEEIQKILSDRENDTFVMSEYDHWKDFQKTGCCCGLPTSFSLLALGSFFFHSI